MGAPREPKREKREHDHRKGKNLSLLKSFPCVCAVYVLCFPCLLVCHGSLSNIEKVKTVLYVSCDCPDFVNADLQWGKKKEMDVYFLRKLADKTEVFFLSFSIFFFVTILSFVRSFSPLKTKYQYPHKHKFVPHSHHQNQNKTPKHTILPVSLSLSHFFPPPPARHIASFTTKSSGRTTDTS
jgi:hypothetical protein